MKTIESILKHAEQIGKEPGKPQDQRTLNLIKIGMRVAINEVQKWIPVEEELPENSQKWHYEVNKNYKYYNYVLCKSKNNKVFIARRYSFMNKNIGWNVSSTSENSITHWRPIEIE